MKQVARRTIDLPKFRICVGKRRELEDSKSVPVVSPIGQKELPVPIGSQTKQHEPIGHKNRITKFRQADSSACHLL
jgi:hypothetical protein